MSIELTDQQDDFDRIIEGTHWNPHSVLGPHPTTVDAVPTWRSEPGSPTWKG